MSSRQAIIRLIRRRTVQEISLTDLIDVVFRDKNGQFDPKLSVYYIEMNDGNVVRINAEHAANIPIDPSNKGIIDLHGLFSVPCEPNRDGGFFSYREDTHYEILYGHDLADVHKSADALHPIIDFRFLEVRRTDLEEYGRTKFHNNDAEWISVCAAYESVRKWASKKPKTDSNNQTS